MNNTDYSKMSDFNINMLVAKLHLDYEDIIEKEPSFGSHVLFGDGYNWYEFDPCNKAGDAWSIIIDNKISLNWAEIEKSWCAHVGGVMTDGCWCWDFDPEHHQGNANPLRAAMIVFLEMNKSKIISLNLLNNLDKIANKEQFDRYE